MELKLYNSLTKQIEPFTPKNPAEVRVYHCGPTVYKRQHIGNMRRFLFADFLGRTLRLFGYDVKDVTNITDVGHLTQDDLDRGEDKLSKAAQEAHVTPQTIAEEQTKLFFQDIYDLNIQDSWEYPRATAYIQVMWDLIKTLLDKGNAYQTATGIYFDVQSFPDYGKLSGNTLDKLEAGARIEVREDKKHPADFALWKFDDTALQKWESPWGTGYPGWHIECSAMALDLLGSDIDIHTGGEDNRFPHHENEIAQSEAATGERFVRIWMHNRHLQIGGQKMAKREGEVITVDTIREHGLSPLAFRLLVFGAHYRSPMDFSWETLKAAQENLESFKNFLRRLDEAEVNPEGPDYIPDQDTVTRFKEALADDLNTPAALAVVQEFIRTINTNLDTDPSPILYPTAQATLAEVDKVLGLFEPLKTDIRSITISEDIQQLAQQREEARQAKDFAKADELRQQIEQAGYVVDDTPTGPRIRRLS